MDTMYEVGDVIVLHPWDKLKEMFGTATCDEGHECINTNPILIDRYKNQYEQGMRVNGIFEGLYQTNQCVVPHEAVSHLKKEESLDHGAISPRYNDIINDVQEYTFTYTNPSEADPRGEDREAAREADGGYRWETTSTLTISTD